LAGFSNEKLWNNLLAVLVKLFFEETEFGKSGLYTCTAPGRKPEKLAKNCHDGEEKRRLSPCDNIARFAWL
jgi:hypothetical protein